MNLLNLLYIVLELRRKVANGYFAHVISPQLNIWSHRIMYCWFSHDVTKIQTTKLSILLRFYFHGVLEQLKTNFHTNFRFKRVLGFVIEYA